MNGPPAAPSLARLSRRLRAAFGPLLALSLLLVASQTVGALHELDLDVHSGDAACASCLIAHAGQAGAPCAAPLTLPALAAALATIARSGWMPAGAPAPFAARAPPLAT